MTRIRAIVWLVVLALSIPLMIFALSRYQAAQASPVARVWGDPHISIVADTTSSMQPKLDALAGAWNSPGIILRPLTATYHLVGFKDGADYLGNTQDADQFGNWLDSLSAEGGGSCPDAALKGLLKMGSNLPESKTPSSDALLVTDATPWGQRQNYAFVVDKMLARGVNVNALLSGWCDGAPLSESALLYLTRATGGFFISSTIASEQVTNTLIGLNLMAYEDLLVSRSGSVSPGQPEIIPFHLDSTMTSLGVEETDRFKCPPWCCLTCTVPSAADPLIAIDAPEMVQVELLDPDGHVIGTGTDGFSVLRSSTNELIQIVEPLTATLQGLWRLRISGNGDFQVNVVGDSGLHLAYLGRHTLALNREVPFRAALLTGNAINAPLTATFRLVSLDGSQSRPIDLFDDGQHGDGENGDGIYGGMIVPGRQGMWRLAVQGRLSDGTNFRRVDPAPIRVQRYRMEDPPGRFLLPGDNRTVNFRLINGLTSESGGSTVFDLALYSAQGWTITGTVPASVTLAPGEEFVFSAQVTIPANAPIGAVEESTLVAVPVGNIGGGISAVSKTTVVDTLKVFLPLLSNRP